MSQFCPFLRLSLCTWVSLVELSGLPLCSQIILQATVRLILRKGQFHPATSLLKSLQWIHVYFRMKTKISSVPEALGGWPCFTSHLVVTVLLYLPIPCHDLPPALFLFNCCLAWAHIKCHLFREAFPGSPDSIRSPVICFVSLSCSFSALWTHVMKSFIVSFVVNFHSLLFNENRHSVLLTVLLSLSSQKYILYTVDTICWKVEWMTK